MRVSPQGVERLIKAEDFRKEAYPDSGGVWTIGYGSTGGVRPGDTITEPEARQRMMAHLARVEDNLARVVAVPLDQDQFDALASLIYNIGVTAFNESTLLRKLNAGKIANATAQFARWNKINGKPSAGLSERRAVEALLFAGDR
jgi:lysozyme